MNLLLILKGLILGFSIAAPVGPIGLLCINKTLSNGKLSGFLSGIGAASADMVYGCIAAFGLSAISGFLLNQAFYIKLFGGLFLCYLGVKTFITGKSKAKENTSKGLLEDYFSTFILTITNPMTIISFTAVFASLGIVTAAKNIVNSSFLVFGVFLGSALWWLLLCFLTGFVGSKSNEKFIMLTNKFSGIIIFTFGLWAIFK